MRKESPSLFLTTFGPVCYKTIMHMWFKWSLNDLRSVSDGLNSRGYFCAKGYNSSASQWLSWEQVRMCSGHPKVHFGTIVEGSWGRGGEGEHCKVERSNQRFSLTGLEDYQHWYLGPYVPFRTLRCYCRQTLETRNLDTFLQTQNWSSVLFLAEVFAADVREALIFWGEEGGGGGG